MEGATHMLNLLGVMELRGSHGTHLIESAAQTTLLIPLLVNRRSFVSASVLAGELWGDSRPGRSENALQAHISRLRKCFKRVDPTRPEGRLKSGPNGYQLLLGDDEVDGERFIRAVQDAQMFSGIRHPADTSSRMRRALAMWRGPVFGGITGGPLCQTEAARYQDARLRAHEILFDSELALGRHALIIGELSALVDGMHLPQERLCAQLMVALYRCGRQVEALGVYQRVRERMAESAGCLPSMGLRRCERAILEHDPALDTATSGFVEIS
ncbi:DNA-binding SARP family transcriptional activator [Streptomyces puniciscabiei]|uniref:DNA-binding SARP family transcriptional activator n=1 Tax=Streptomyces puniciscabiei TaxID=164348 RepID=A0A542UGY2_9ACTN|nr:AfsR/SARP family transcriptional regulator [Streptomyces puniciscabiei]TQK98340.1 DNA-binding SARP family transcriptional activator [Streptomyces puniciscabiei]